MSTPDNSPPREDEVNLDYQVHEMDLQQVHESILREQHEPLEGSEPVPFWLTLSLFVFVFVCGGYLMAYSGGFSANVFDERQVTWGPVEASGPKVVDVIAIGRRLYTANCSSCHQPTGLGVPGQYPPLAGSEWVLGEDGWGENHLGKIMLHGLQGPIQVRGNPYNGNMPAQRAALKDDQIAHILTYIRQEWGNAAGPIFPEGIASLRALHDSRTQPWTEAELRAIPPAPLPGPAGAPVPAPNGEPVPVANGTSG
jgi:mono/diheme cytochrome c family protein